MPLQWKSIVDELVTALSARTLLLQFLAIAKQRNKAQNKVREISLRVVSYVGLLKRLDAIARILFGKLKSIEMIPLEKYTVRGERITFVPEFDPFLSFGIWQSNLVEFDETVDFTRQWWLLKNGDAFTDNQNLMTTDVALEMMELVKNFESKWKKEDFFDVCAKNYELTAKTIPVEESQQLSICTLLLWLAIALQNLHFR